MNGYYVILITLITLTYESNLKKRQLSSASNLKFIFPKCTSNKDCSDHGVCDVGLGYCKCDKTYVTYIDTEEYNEDNINNTDSNIEIKLPSEFKSCNYKLRKQLTALMISIFVGFGSEHFYMENYSVAAGKFVFYIFCYYLNIGVVVFYFFFKQKRDLLKFIGIFEGIYMGLGFTFMFFWNLYDWIKIGMNEMPDGKGYKLYSWNDDDNVN